MTATNTDNQQTPLPSWTLVTSHGLVLLYVASHPDATIREIASAIELTERRVADIIHDLSVAEMIEVGRVGRRNHYVLTANARFRHPYMSDIPFDSFVALWRMSKIPPEVDFGHS